MEAYFTKVDHVSPNMPKANSTFLMSKLMKDQIKSSKYVDLSIEEEKGVDVTDAHNSSKVFTIC